jgi:hypothetical protein
MRFQELRQKLPGGDKPEDFKLKDEVVEDISK